ncbi:MAG: DUF2203 domain-containing protein [Chloroflexi bacterium]|nr:MAG: DUF2203 domain-containing protein [Chloroflexota bacterium]
MPHRFSREEADALLPEIAPRLVQLRDLKRENDETRAAVDDLQGTLKTNGHSLDIELARLARALQATGAAIKELVERVVGFGAEVKDLEMGLVDFRSERDGREVYLCWKLGEERVSFWHELNTGYASRQPLD